MDLFHTIKKGDKIVCEFTAEEDYHKGEVTLVHPEGCGYKCSSHGLIGKSIVKVIPRQIEVGDIVKFHRSDMYESYKILFIHNENVFLERLGEEPRYHTCAKIENLVRVP